MILTIICGGSGSETLQTELYNINKNISLNLIINGYDDGKSTGILRNIFKDILGISDFRKNQILEYKLRYGNNKIYSLLNHRFTNNEDPYKYIFNLINEIFNDNDNNNNNNNDNLKEFLIYHTNNFFNLNITKDIEYHDFNFMNIIYCSLLYENNNDMITVCNIIKKILKLKNNIFINSNENLILNAITKNNNILKNEESIVNFNDKNDKIIDIYFNNNKYPILNEKTEQILLNSDIIIASCGTQFSSLIPTYKTIGFKETLHKSKANKYLILNCDFDNDIINYNADELLDKINEYIILNDFNIIISNDYIKELIPIKCIYNIINIEKLIINNKHNGFLLWKYILQDYFKSYFNDFYIFDYDYTIFDKNNIDTSIANIKLLEQINNSIIVTNNSYDNLLPINNITIYSNFGNIINNHNDNNKIIETKYILDLNDITFIMNIINSHNHNNYNIENRQNISIAIKCNDNDNDNDNDNGNDNGNDNDNDNGNDNDNRNEYYDKLKDHFNNTSYNIIKTGKTTIEIVKNGLCKRNSFIYNNFFKNTNTYITDCNDINYNSKTDNLKYLEIQNINKTNLFLNSIIINQKYDFCIIIAGINSRINIHFPKSLMNTYNIIDENFNYFDDIILTKIIKNIIPYANNIFICCNNLYKHHFINYQIKLNNNIHNNNIKFLFFNSINNLQNYPNGNAETIFQLLHNEQLTKKIFIMWGDIFISNNKIFEEIYNLQYDNDFLIPTIYDKNPYAYLIINHNNLVQSIEYFKNIPIDFGFHDQCIFLCNIHILNKFFYNILSSQNDNNFLDIIKFIDNTKYYITNYSIKTYNSIEEFNSIINNNV